MTEEIVTPSECEKYRAACRATHLVFKQLIEEAIKHTAEISAIQQDMTDKHTEKLFSMINVSTIKNGKDIGELHSKINGFIWSVLVGVIIGAIGVIVPYSNNVKAINTVETNLNNHIADCAQTKVIISNVKNSMDRFNNHVAQSDLLIKKYDGYEVDIHNLEFKVKEIELFNAKTHK